MKSKYKIDLLSPKDFTDKEKEEHEIPEHGNECLILVIYRDGKIMEVYHDMIESEDVSFGRSLYWVTMELERAYELGYKDGQQDLARQVFGDRVYKFLESAGDVLKGLAKWKPKIILDRRTVDKAIEDKKISVTKRRKVVREEDLIETEIDSDDSRRTD